MLEPRVNVDPKATKEILVALLAPKARREKWVHKANVENKGSLVNKDNSEKRGMSDPKVNVGSKDSLANREHKEK